jgi:hypothetical protein
MESMIKAGEFIGAKLPNSIPVKKGTVNEAKTVYNDLNNSYLAKARAANPDVDPADVYWGTGGRQKLSLSKVMPLVAAPLIDRQRLKLTPI